MESQRSKILVVEDDAGVARLERLRLERAGYEVLTAGTAEEALARLGEEDIALLLLDQRLASGVSGLDLYEQVRVAGYDVPAILVTGLQEERLLVRALRAGVRDFVPKTMDFLDYLVPAVERVLHQVATERQLAVERRHASRARAVAAAALRIQRAQSLEGVLQAVTEEACRILRARLALTRLAPDDRGRAVRTTIFPNDSAAANLAAQLRSDQGPAMEVSRNNHSLRLLASALENESTLQQIRPHLHGWLGAPLIDRDGRNLGLIQTVDKVEVEFTEEDEAVLAQLASLAAVALENVRLVEELRAADRRKDEFLAMLAHELRNPLAPMRNSLEIIRLRGPERRQSVRESWDMIERQVEHLSRLVDDLLDVSRITRGKIKLDRSPVEVAEVVRRAVETSRPLIEGRRHHLEIRQPSQPLYVQGDMTRLAQVLMNLLNNAAKYTEEGGQITLVVETQGGTQDRPADVLLRVRDTGMGIPPEILPQVFDLFTQADRSLDRSQGGLGIGLTLVRRLVEMHNGGVQAYSAGVGRGSEFVVRLPLNWEVVPGSGPAPNGALVPTKSRRILVVDDSRDSALSLAMLLRLLGNDVATAHDGPAALEVAQRFGPEIAFLDIGLPGMDGFELARRLRTLPGLRKVRLAALTGYGSAEDRRRSQEAGFDRHLVKPMEMETLQAVLEDFWPEPGHAELAPANLA
jgi:signal transduction histidine kinase/DNA-binding response OmpR family regulator